jgi:hypothetical protein
VIAAVAATALGRTDFSLSWNTLDGGGVMFSSGGEFELSGTIGQPDAASGAPRMSGEDFTLTGGFWFETPLGDCNTTGFVNLLDYRDLEACLSGPDGGLPAPDCNCFDIDSDNDVDLSDASRFHQMFTGG